MRIQFSVRRLMFAMAGISVPLVLFWRLESTGKIVAIVVGLCLGLLALMTLPRHRDPIVRLVACGIVGSIAGPWVFGPTGALGGCLSGLLLAWIASFGDAPENVKEHQEKGSSTLNHGEQQR